ncbi:hypothetical protein EDD21DRAFT_392244 [Dissophora ornata]|nr:hypothetical protein EDD21DRAFT_392244 [Dissophora ornata]
MVGVMAYYTIVMTGVAMSDARIAVVAVSVVVVVAALVDRSIFSLLPAPTPGASPPCHSFVWLCVQDLLQH